MDSLRLDVPPRALVDFHYKLMNVHYFARKCALYYQSVSIFHLSHARLRLQHVTV